MTVPFAAALDLMFGSAMATAATYTAAGGQPRTIRVTRDQGSQELSLNGGAAIVDANAVQIRRSEVALPDAGDAVTIGDDHFIIQGGATLDVEGLTWTCYLEPA